MVMLAFLALALAEGLEIFCNSLRDCSANCVSRELETSHSLMIRFASAVAFFLVIVIFALRGSSASGSGVELMCLGRSGYSSRIWLCHSLRNCSTSALTDLSL